MKQKPQIACIRTPPTSPSAGLSVSSQVDVPNWKIGGRKLFKGAASRLNGLKNLA